MARTTNTLSSGSSESHERALVSALAEVPVPGALPRVAQLLQAIWSPDRGVAGESSAADHSVSQPRKNIIPMSVRIPRSWASKTELRYLRAAEMEYWRETGGDALRSQAVLG
jgi:hypothetical protein